MRKSIKKILVTTLAVTLLVPSINVSAYTFNKKADSDVYEVSDIKNLQMIRDGATTDINMLNDIVERAYNNNFQNKNYIIKNQSEDLGRWDSDGYDLWGNYVLSRGDTYIATTFTEKAVVRDGEDYYHSVSVTSKPAWDSGAISGGVKCIDAFDRESRSIMKNYWDAYMNGIKKAEKEIGFTEGNNLCDFQLILQTYIWIKDNIKSDTSPNVYLTRGQTAIEGILGGATMCAGQSRLFNRFMHDFGIESYWIDNPNLNHAWNFVKLENKSKVNIFGGIDCQGTSYFLEDNIYTCNVFTPVGQNSQKYYKEVISVGKSILTYDNDFVNQFRLSLEEKNIENVSYDSVLPKYSKDGEVFIQKANCPYCAHKGKTIQHSFTTGNLSTQKNGVDIKKENDKNIIGNASFEVYNNRFNYNTGGYDNFLKIEQGTRTEYETNTTTAAPTTTEEPTSDDSEVTKETTAPDVEVPTTTEPEVEVPTTASRPEPATSDRVVVIPTSSNSTTKPETTTTKKPESTTTVKNGTSNIKNYNCSIDKKEEDDNNIKLSIEFNANKKYTHVKVEYKDKATNKKTLKWVKVSNNKSDVIIPKKSKNTVYDIKVTGVKVKIGKAKIKNVKVRKRSITFKVTCKGAKKIKITYKKKGKIITKWIKVNKNVTLKGLSRNKKYKIKVVGTIDKSSTSPKGKSATKKVTTK